MWSQCNGMRHVLFAEVSFLAMTDHLPAITALHCTTKEIKTVSLGECCIGYSKRAVGDMGGEQK